MLSSSKNVIEICRESDIPKGQLSLYSPVSVLTLKNAGVDMRGYMDDEIVYLDAENYHKLSIYQGENHMDISNIRQVEDIDNTILDEESQRGHIR